MHFTSRLAAASALLALLLLSGCNGSFSQDLLRAQQAEQQGDTAQALAAYEKALQPERGVSALRPLR